MPNMKEMRIKMYLALIAVVCFGFGFLQSQEIDAVKEVNADSLQTAKQDSISYAADEVINSLTIEKIFLIGDASLKYHSSNIKADSITVDLKKEQAQTIGQSLLQDGSHILIGEGISFDLETQEGMIKSGASKFEKGYYYGEEIRKTGEKQFDVDNGVFTTCDALHPHFDISMKKLRLYQGDKIVAKPAVFYVNHFPVFALPFGTFSIKSGRKSGILVPHPGMNSTDGKYIEDIAFYYAYKDYADLLFSVDYYEKTGWEANFTTDYIQRYIMNGKFSASLKKRTLSLYSSQYDWRINADHHHDFGNKTTLDADLEFVSSSRILEGSIDIDERLNEEISSSVAYKRPLWNRTLYVYADYTDNLEQETKDISLPRISWSLPTKPVYELFLSDDADAEDSWWSDFNYSYRFNAEHSGDINDPDADFDDVLWKSTKDSTGVYINEHHAGIKHNAGLNYSYKFKGWLNLKQSFSYNDVWFDRDREDNKLVRGYDYGTTSTTSFSLYGLRRFKRGYVSAVRHIVSPTAKYSWSPDFTDNSKYYNYGGLRKSAKAKKVSFTMGNKWQLKLRETENKKERKLNDFFKIDSNANYNFMADEEPWSDISHTVTLKPNKFTAGILDLSFSPSGTLKQNPYWMNLNNFNPQNWNFGVSDWSYRTSSKISIGADAEYYDYFPLPPNKFVSNKFFGSDSLSVEEENEIDTLEELENLEREQKSWILSFSHTYKMTKTNYPDNNYTSSLRTSLSAKITKNWSVDYDNYINLKEKKVVSHNVTFTRELHCWKLYFRYTKQSDYWNYQFKIFNIKLPSSLFFRKSDKKKNY